jgi:hypothetical protein
MPIFVNVGHVPEDGGKPWKHLSAHCDLLLARAAEGCEAKKVRNQDNKKPLDAHVYRRCPICGGEAGPLASVPTEPGLL